MKKIVDLLPGLLFTAFLAVISLFIQQITFVQKMHLSSLIIAIILGILVSNIMKIPKLFSYGIQFSFKKVLRLGVILLGMKLSFTEVSMIGWKGILLVLIVTPATILIAIFLGKKFGLEKNLSILIGTGTGICGASAIAAISPVIDGDEKDSTFAIATVTIFGTIAMFLYPIIFRIFHIPNLIYAVWTGSSIHEVAQVIAAGYAAGDQALQFATIIKLTRVLLVVPFALIVSILQLRGSSENKGTGKLKRESIPWFVFGFLAVFIINSLNVIPKPFMNPLITSDGFLLTWAMAGMGLSTNFNKIKQVGIKATLLGLIIWAFIAIFGFIVSSLLFS